jgi:hypothetical protein
MTVWGTILIISLLIVLSVFIGLNVMTTTNNQKIAQTQKFQTFSSAIDPKTGQPTFPEGGSSDAPFTVTDENSKIIPQIQCPVGTKINILGAFFDIFDPYATCSATEDQVSPYFGFLCIPDHVGKTRDGNTVIAPCVNDKKCADYGAPNQFMCSTTSGTCVLKPQDPVNGAPPTAPKGLSTITVKGKYYFVNPDTCASNIDLARATSGTGTPNQYCSPGSTAAQCAIRDASATVAAKCNGRQSCGDLTMADFGDYPCFDATGAGVEPKQCILGTNQDGTVQWYESSPPAGLHRTTGYCSLPYLQGFEGGYPQYGTQQENPNYNHGYTMHGLFSCVAE